MTTPRHFGRRKMDYSQEHQDNFEVSSSYFDDEEEEDPGVYRSYEDYLASGESVDPCDDALWLHDQE